MTFNLFLCISYICSSFLQSSYIYGAIKGYSQAMFMALPVGMRWRLKCEKELEPKKHFALQAFVKRTPIPRASTFTI